MIYCLKKVVSYFYTLWWYFLFVTYSKWKKNNGRKCLNILFVDTGIYNKTLKQQNKSFKSHEKMFRT